MSNEEKNTCEVTNCNCEVEYVDIRPAADVYEEDNGVYIIFEVPGCNNTNVDIEVKDRILSVNAKSTLKRDGNFIRYRRVFQLSDAVDITQITASTCDGVLKLFLPKSEQAKVHKIKVSA
jgi:HSP20 family protein